jgi:hypothetical protein
MKRTLSLLLMAYCFLLLIAALLPMAVWAAAFPQNLTLSWTNASQYTDGTDIDPVDLTGVRILCTRTNDGEVLINTTLVPTGVGLAQQEVFTDVITRAGTVECVGFTVVSDGTESDPSGTAIKKYIGKPQPPENVNQ